LIAGRTPAAPRVTKKVTIHAQNFTLTRFSRLFGFSDEA
jgi:hypothetical protein